MKALQQLCWQSREFASAIDNRKEGGTYIFKLALSVAYTFVVPAPVLTERDVANDLLVSLSSSFQTTPGETGTQVTTAPAAPTATTMSGAN